MANGFISSVVDRGKSVATRATSAIFGPKNVSAVSYKNVDGHKVPERLYDAMKKNYSTNLASYRDQAKAAISQYAGNYCDGDDFMRQRVVINKIQQYVRTYMRLFASGNPQAIVTTNYKDLKPFAETFQIGLNRRLTEIELGASFQLAVLSSFFGPGVMKTGIAEGSEGFEIDGVFYDPGVAFSQCVSIDNFVMDMEAQRLEDITFIGDRYRRPRHWVKKISKAKGVTGIERRDMSPMNPDGRVSGISEDPDNNLYDMVWCWDLYLPKQNLIVMFADGDNTPLMAYEWDGPEGGPYDILQYDRVPGESVPIAPTSQLMPLHNLINNLMRKLENQAKRQKSLTAYQQGSEEDAQAIKDAKDGETIGLMHPDSISAIQTGGTDPGNFNFGLWAAGEFDIQAGNLESIAGLAPQSETFKQDQLLSQSANTQVDAMRLSVLNFYSRVIKKHAWYLWVDQLHDDMELYKTVPGTGLHVPVTLSPEIREGDFIQYNFDINPHSLQEDTPAEKSQKLLGMLQNLVIPTAQFAMQQGYTPNIVGAVKQLAEYQGVPIEQLYMAADPSMEQDKPGQIPQPGGTHSLYERVSSPGQTSNSRRTALMAANANMQSPNQMGQQFQRAG